MRFPLHKLFFKIEHNVQGFCCKFSMGFDNFIRAMYINSYSIMILSMVLI